MNNKHEDKYITLYFASFYDENGRCTHLRVRDDGKETYQEAEKIVKEGLLNCPLEQRGRVESFLFRK